MLTKTKLKDVCFLVTDGTHDTPKIISEGYPLIKAKEITSGKIDFTDCDYISEDDHIKVISRSKPEKGDTLFTHIGASLGVAAYINTNREFSIKNVALFKPNPSIINKRYFYYLIIDKHFQEFIINKRGGAAQPFVGLDTLRNHEISYNPDRIAQNKIAHLLSNYDDLIENNCRRVQFLESMAKLIYDEWFVKFKFPGHETVKMIDSGMDFGEIPEGWEVKKISDIVHNVKDSISADNVKKDIHYLPIDLIPRKSMLLQEVAPIEEAQSSLTLFKRGDIVFGSMRAYFHKVIIAPFDGVTRKTCFTLRAKSNSLWSFSYLTLFKESTVEFASLHSNGSTIPYAVWDNGLAEMKIIVPPQNILDEFDNIVAPILKTIIGMFFKNRNLVITRDLLLPKLISGELDVSELDIKVSGVEV